MKLWKTVHRTHSEDKMTKWQNYSSFCISVHLLQQHMLLDIEIFNCKWGAYVNTFTDCGSQLIDLSKLLWQASVSSSLSAEEICIVNAGSTDFFALGSSWSLPEPSIILLVFRLFSPEANTVQFSTGSSCITLQFLSKCIMWLLRRLIKDLWCYSSHFIFDLVVFMLDCWVSIMVEPGYIKDRNSDRW